MCFGCSIPLSSQSISFDLPCEDRVWDLGMNGLLEGLSTSSDSRVQLRKVLFELFSKDMVNTCNLLQNLSNFSRVILVCAVFETVIHAKSSPLSYNSFEDYKNGNLSATNTRDPLIEALRNCHMLWPAQLHDYWDGSASSYPELEGAMLLQFAIIQINRLNNASYSESLYSREAVIAATEVFCSIAKSGFDEVRCNHTEYQSTG